MAIKVIVELQAKPGRRDELEGLLESLVASQGPSQRGYLRSARRGERKDEGVTPVVDLDAAVFTHTCRMTQRCSASAPA